MINNYEIKIINGEERLFLYLDFKYEFANLDLKTQKRSLESAINEFIIKNHIIFKGSIVSLIVGGVLVGDLVLKQPVLSKELSVIEEITPKVVEVDKLMSIPELPKIDEIEIIYPKEEDNTNTSISKQITETIKKKAENAKNNTSVNKVVETPKVSETPKVVEQPKIVETPKVEEKKEVVDNNTYVNVKRSNGEVLKIELEEYLIGVVGAEMPALFNIEALKSQAVVSRTYTLKCLSIGKTLTDNASTQMYKSKGELQSMWGANFNSYYAKVKQAVDSTKGEYLTYNGTYIDAVYHSTSNGRTEDASNVWENSYPYLVSVESQYDSLNPTFQYELTLSYQDISNKLGMDINKDTIINILGKTIGNRVAQISIYDKTYTGVEFRNKLGLRSADFEFEKLDNGIKFKTKGYGHGVGMSQYGANGMAKNGSNYQTILKHYYKGVSISKK